MPSTIGEAFVAVRADTSGFQSSASRGVLGSIGSIAKTGASLLAGFGLFKVIKDDVIGFNATLEQTKVAFTNLLGSGKAANEMLANLQQFAKVTPFSFEQLIPLSQQLIGSLGGAADTSQELTGIMTQLGDAISATGGSSDQLRLLTTAYSQAATSGTVHMQDLLQINNAFPGSLAKMADAAGVSIGQFREDVANGMVTSAKFVELFKKVTTDKKFGIGGAMEAQSHTFRGALSNIQDALQQGLAKAGAGIFEFVRQVTVGFATFLGILQSQGLDQAILQTFGPEVLAGFQTFVSVLETGAGLVERLLGTIVDAFTENQGTIVAVLAGITSAFATVFGFIEAHQETFIAIAKAVGIAVAALLGLSATIVIIQGVAAALLLLTSPIAIVIAVAAAVIYAYQHFETFRNIVNSVVGFLVTFIPAAMATIRDVIVGAVNAAVAAWNQFPLIQALVTNALNTIVAVIRAAMTIIQGVINVVLGIIRGDWSQVMNGLKQIVQGTFNLIVAIIRGTLNNAVTIAQSLGSNIKNVLINAVQAIPGLVRGIFSRISGAISGVASAVFNAARNLAQSMYNGVVNKVKEIPGKVSTLIASIPGKIGDVGSLLYDIGVAIAHSLLDGLVAGFVAVYNEVAGWADKIKDIKGPIEVDRKLLIPAGLAITEGLHKGLSDSFANVERLVSGFAPRIQASFGTPQLTPNLGTAGLASTAAATSTVSVTIAAGAIVVQGSTNPQETGRAVVDAIFERAGRLAPQ